MDYKLMRVLRLRETVRRTTQRLRTRVETGIEPCSKRQHQGYLEKGQREIFLASVGRNRAIYQCDACKRIYTFYKSPDELRREVSGLLRSAFI